MPVFSGKLQFLERPRILWWSVAVPIAIISAGCGNAPKAGVNDIANVPRVAVVSVKRQDISSTLEIASEFQPYQEISVYAKVSGYVKKLNVDWGTHVKQGQLLGVLEVPELQQQIDVDQATVARSEHDVERAHEDLNSAEAAYNVAHLTFTRLAGVQKNEPNLVAQEEVDQARGKDTQANAGVSAANDSLAATEQGLAAARASLEKDKALFAYSQIIAPFEGVVTEIDAYTGALLPAGTSSNKGDLPLCHLAQNNLLRLVIPVPERAVGRVLLGRPVSVRVTTLDRTFQGKIARVSDQIDTDTRTMHSEVDVPNPDYTLVPGMYATVEVPLQTQHGVLVVPTRTVEASGEGQGTVLVVGRDNKIEKRSVATGIEGPSYVQILSGLGEDDRVLVGEQTQYKAGEIVNPQAASPLE